MTASGLDVPLGPDSLKEISIIQNVNNLTPIVQATIVDTAALHAMKNAFADGAPITIGLGPGNGNVNSTQFIRFNAPKIDNAQGADIISFTAQHPAGVMMRNLQSKSFSKMPSSNALQQLAGQLGIPFQGDSTSDAMTWLPNNRPIGQWMRHVANHAYASSQSAMHLAMGGRGDGNWTLLFKDVIKAVQGSPMAQFVTRGYDTAGQIGVDGPTIWRSHSGSLNSLLGYSGITQQVNIQGAVQQFQQVAAGLSTGSFNIASAIQSIITQSPRQFIPRDRGNTHANFAQAVHQNDRLKATFSSFLSILTTDFTNVQVLDPVNVTLYQNDQLNMTQNGKYIVHSRTQHGTGQNYFELIVLASQGANGGTGLVN
jgi:hypothetical protein